MTTLESVLTLTEVSRMWAKHPTTVRNALGARKRPLVFRQTDRVYLVTYESCLRRWGPPRFPLDPV